MNNTIQSYNTCLNTARDARADAIKQALKGTFATLRVVVREHTEGILAAAYVAVSILAVSSL